MYKIGSIISWESWPTLHFKVLDIKEENFYILEPLNPNHPELRHYSPHKKEKGIYGVYLSDGWTVLKDGPGFERLFEL